ncbi:MAG: MFS transporter, partial [Chloroflexia bacterium]|nr:MFS transporter [Chloroflexia bacterium]
MSLAIFFISTFGAGASAVMVALGMLGLGIGMAFVQSPTSNAATNSLPADAVGGGMGIYSGAFFLGAGTGPALIGALLAARQEAGAVAINPLYTLDAAPYSDAFLALAVAPLIALIAALGLRGGSTGNRHSTPDRERR